MVPYFIYNAVLSLTLLLALPFAPVLLLARARYRTGLGQRLGYYGSTLKGFFAGHRPIWIHAASVGEVRSIRDLVGELKQHFPDCRIVLSTFTATGNRLARRALVSSRYASATSKASARRPIGREIIGGGRAARSTAAASTADPRTRPPLPSDERPLAGATEPPCRA